jgi:hypothetical protein
MRQYSHPALVQEVAVNMDVVRLNTTSVVRQNHDAELLKLVEGS